mgnify:FL=1
MLEIIESGIPLTYLDMMKYTALNSEAWHMKYPQNHPDKHLKMDIIDGNARQPLLAGMAMGLLILLYDKRPDLFLPEITYAGISIKDKNRLDNPHTDHVNDLGHIKIFGVLNSDWGSMDGGLFLHGDEAIPMVPGTFVVFDPRITHSASEIHTNKQRIGLDFTVPKLAEGP